jgi:N-glycosylase/DNA lyase
MGTSNYSYEFQPGAVQQIKVGGYAVREVSQLLGMSARDLPMPSPLRIPILTPQGQLFQKSPTQVWHLWWPLCKCGWRPKWRSWR